MKSWALAAVFVSVAALVACEGDGTTDDGGGGNGGSGGSATTTTTTSTSTGMGGSMAMGCGETSADCAACQTCTVAPGGPCEAQYQACNGIMECVDLLTCVQDCQAMFPMDEAAFNTCALDPMEPMSCVSLFPGGVDPLNLLLECIFAPPPDGCDVICM
jgi:hypothetical protein